MSEWQPINTAPKDGSVILVAHKRGTWRYPKDQHKISCVVVFWSVDRFEQFGPDYFVESELTHWMLFQPPPQSTGSDVMKVGSEEWWMEKIEEQRRESFRLGLQAGFALAALIFGVLFNLDKFQ